MTTFSQGLHVGVVVDQLLQAQDQVDDVLGDGIGRGRLGPEEHGDGPLRQVARLDLQVLVDDVQGVHLLALVLVQPLDLDVEDGMLVQRPRPAGCCRYPAQLPLVLLLDGQQPVQGRLVVLVVPAALPAAAASFFQPVADAPRDPGRLSSGLQCSSHRRKVMPLVLLLNFSGYSLGKGLQLGLLQNLRVQGWPRR